MVPDARGVKQPVAVVGPQTHSDEVRSTDSTLSVLSAAASTATDVLKSHKVPEALFGQ